ncbi:unnamed protein product [Paramecium octaurelia]|uniref:Tetratricopeptide repeat protein n=1 Tax=Paramecium octaurelia TaxID=43137 RepID=A0A8S1YNX4_PAROT|nr:unnamed protein product [Paramecium octaurelia]
MYIQIRQIQNSYECYNKAIAFNPILILHGIIKGIKFDYFYFGLALQQLKQYQDAILCFVKATFINPKNEYAWKNQVYNLSIYFFFRYNLNCLNKYKEAIVSCEKAISLNPNNDHAIVYKGLIFLKLGFALIQKLHKIPLYQLKKYQEALLCYNTALSGSVHHMKLKLKADSLKLLIEILAIFELGLKSQAKFLFCCFTSRITRI